MSEKKKMGRPTTDPKPHKISARVSNDTLAILDSYCVSKKLTRPEGIRAAIDHLKDEK